MRLPNSGLAGLLRGFLLATALPLVGCATFTAERTYDAPYPYVAFAAREAFASVDFVEKRVSANGTEIWGGRRRSMGFLAGAGGERLTIRVSGTSESSRVVVECKIGGMGFAVQQDHSERVAKFLDHYVAENRRLHDQILVQAGMTPATPPLPHVGAGEPGEEEE